METSNNSGKISFLKSIKAKVMLVVFVSVVFTFFLLEILLLNGTKETLKETNGNYLLDMAEISCQLLDEKIDLLGDEAALEYDNLDSVFNGVGVEGISSSYAYVVDATGTMLYHPSPEKVGNPVSNDCVKQVVADIEAGKVQPGKSEFVAYVYNGADKYAAYKIASDMSIVVVTADEDEIMASQNKLIKFATVVGIIILVITMTVGYFTSVAIAKPIINVTSIVEKTSDLDFTEAKGIEKLIKRSDENGAMARAVERMQEKMSDVIHSLKEQGETLKKASDELSNSATETSTTIEQVEKAVSEIADGAGSQAEETQKATESVILMGNMVEETNAEVEKLSETARVMKKSGDFATQTLTELESINTKAKESIDIIYEQTNTTNTSANKIREATAIITSIADETNLLSLNASIEAARAGEQGRGFAVVAAQISKLAEQSNESARQIEAIIDSLIADSEKSVETMDEVQKIMLEQSEKVSQTVEMFGQVKDGISTSIEGIGNIAQKTKKLDDARVTVVDVVQNLTAIAEENAASTEETSASVTEVTNIVYGISQNANKLDEVADELQDNVNLFNVM